MVFGKEETNSTMVCLSWMQVLLEWQRLACLYLIILVSYITFHSCVYASFNTIICSPIHWKFCKWKILQIHVLGKPFYYINTRETRCAFAQKHGIFARELITCYLHMWKDCCCYGYIINCAFRSKKLLKWNDSVFHRCLYNK